ncbi:MAG TPA: hypothetical protein VIL32_05140 [Steroidobacteraceae bacterium]
MDGYVLVDKAAEPGLILPPNTTVLPPMSIESGADLAQLIREHRITDVVDLSYLDTRECLRVCEELGVRSLCTSVEEWEEGSTSTAPTDVAISRMLPPNRPQLRQSHLIGSGANPGIVNALMFAALAEFGERVGVAPTPEALDLHAALITEEDTTLERCSVDSAETFPMTWSPRHCLEELFERRTLVARAGVAEGFGHRPAERQYRARCGDTEIEGFLVPHEEVITLSHCFPSLEIGFIYRINPAARWALRMHPERKVAEWRTQRLWPPYTGELVGEDRLGVLLCSRRYGELWMGLRTDVTAGLKLGTNATLLQVAAGVLAGWNQLGTRAGIHFVEHLDWRAFMRVVYQVLGPPMVVHDTLAPPRFMKDRLVDARSAERSRRLKSEVGREKAPGSARVTATRT